MCYVVKILYKFIADLQFELLGGSGFRCRTAHYAWYQVPGTCTRYQVRTIFENSAHLRILGPTQSLSKITPTSRFRFRSKIVYNSRTHVFSSSGHGVKRVFHPSKHPYFECHPEEKPQLKLAAGATTFDCLDPSNYPSNHPSIHISSHIFPCIFHVLSAVTRRISRQGKHSHEQNPWHDPE